MLPWLPTSQTQSPDSTDGAKPVAVIGAGFSGTMVAIHLAAQLPPGHSAILCERGSFGRGAAYGTANARHLLNVRAANMSAFPSEPQHFQTWLRSAAGDGADEIKLTEAGIFASRSVYGRYLNDLIASACRKPAPNLELVADDVVDIAPDGTGHCLIFASGARRAVSAVVLAVGNMAAAEAGGPLYRANAWDPGATDDLRADAPVLVIGTGLTMVDLTVDMHSRGFAGPVIAISRRGLLPHRHAAACRWPTPPVLNAGGQNLLTLLRQVNREVRRAQDHGVDWRGVVDSLRPITASLWQGMSWDDRARFLRHLRPFWDVHRHRIAEPVAQLIDTLRAQGFLIIRRGRIVDMQFGEDCVDVSMRLRATGQEQRITVQRVINATGIAHVRHADSPLIKALLDRGLIRLDTLGLGLDVTGGLQAIGMDGAPSAALWALGPLVRGVFWECVAVPDIRMQAERVARLVTDAVTQRA